MHATPRETKTHPGPATRRRCSATGCSAGEPCSTHCPVPDPPGCAGTLPVEGHLHRLNRTTTTAARRRSRTGTRTPHPREESQNCCRQPSADTRHRLRNPPGRTTTHRTCHTCRESTGRPRTEDRNHGTGPECRSGHPEHPSAAGGPPPEDHAQRSATLRHACRDHPWVPRNSGHQATRCCRSLQLLVGYQVGHDGIEGPAGTPQAPCMVDLVATEARPSGSKDSRMKPLNCSHSLLSGRLLGPSAESDPADPRWPTARLGDGRPPPTCPRTPRPQAPTPTGTTPSTAWTATSDRPPLSRGGAEGSRPGRRRLLG
ncbi:hypothetical protein SCNRRL3882_0723 [Streptomyces chartreusis NRRL 3882]|uniref:Uncharacterized protein n=1 Tax=Streptomyces chartreusis NRRL 3882 TaxID=1079985 RepID=A0A2N9B1P2_STRCX|nr:hypothetical protein SCNRRL3882_0723 [Streptomyces chartreusis NRRL 3882]